MNNVIRSLFAAALAAVFVCPVAGFAQQPGQAQRTTGERAQTTPRAILTDSQLAAALILENHKEIAISELAAQQSKDENVKAFAQKMVKDHQQFVQKLQRFTESAGITPQQLTLQTRAIGERDQTATPPNRQQADSSDRERPEENGTRRQAARPDFGDTSAGAGVEFIRLKQELAEASLQSIRQNMEEKSGAEFDQCYMLGQVMAHMFMSDALTVLSDHVSPQLQETLQEGLRTTKQHMQEAKQLAKQMEGTQQSAN